MSTIMFGILLLFHWTLFEICVDFILLAYRMKGNKVKQIKEDGRELEQGIHLVKAPLAMQEEPRITLSTKEGKMKVKVSISKQQKQHSMEG